MGLIRGKAFIFGDNINIDIIHPANYFSLDQEKVREGLFMGISSSIAKQIRASHGIIIGGKNFGCGSSREVAAQSFVYNNVKVLVAESFARIFYRNCLNLGLLLFERKGILALVSQGDEIAVRPDSSIMINISKRLVIKCKHADLLGVSR